MCKLYFTPWKVQEMKNKSTAIELNRPLGKKKTFLQRLKEEKYLQVMAWLGIIWMLIFNYAPMYGLLIAFKKNYKITTPLFSKQFLTSAWASEFGFHHFINFFRDDEFKNIMINTLGISLIKLAVCFPLPIVFAILLNEVRNPHFKKSIQTISYLPHFLSWVVLGGILTTWLDKSGLFNQILTGLGIIKEPKAYLAYPEYFWTIIILSDLWKEMGWSAIIYLAAISGIDQEMYEAAEVDGAGRLRKILSITLPAISGTVVIMFILQVGQLLNSNFDQIFVLWNPLNTSRSNVIDLYTYTTGMRGMRFSYATAIGFFKSIVAFILLFIANQVSKRIGDTSLF